MKTPGAGVNPTSTSIGVGTAAQRPASAPGNQPFWYATDTNTLSYWSGSAWQTITGGVVGPANFQYAIGSQNGDFNTTSSAFGDITKAGGWNLKGGGTNANGLLSIAAVANDLLELELIADITNTANATLIDFSVGGSLVGLSAAYRDANSLSFNQPCKTVVAVTAGMIAGGVVACKPQWANLDNSSNQTIKNESTQKRAPVFTVKNWLH